MFSRKLCTFNWSIGLFTLSTRSLLSSDIYCGHIMWCRYLLEWSGIELYSMCCWELFTVKWFECLLHLFVGFILCDRRDKSRSMFGWIDSKIGFLWLCTMSRWKLCPL